MPAWNCAATDIFPPPSERIARTALPLAESFETRPSASARLRASLGQRGVAFLLALAVELLVALLLWFMAPVLAEKKPPPTTTTFGIDTAPGDTEQPARAEQKKAAAKSNGSDRARKVEPKPVETPQPEPPAEPVPQTFIRMTRRDYAAADIAGMKSSAPAVAAAGEGEAGSAGGSRAGDTAIVGKAPNGEPLYAAEWYRRPTHAELQPYISRRARGPGWGLIACRTAPGHRVEDCQELSESPRGSGYGGSVRQAAWQFRVRAPRVGGKELTGTWVRIQITYTQGESE